jgi:hypothetical protein
VGSVGSRQGQGAVSRKEIRWQVSCLSAIISLSRRTLLGFSVATHFIRRMIT